MGALKKAKEMMGGGTPSPFGGNGGQDPEIGAGKRQIPAGHPYNPKDIKPLAKMLWAISVSMGHALTAYKEFTRLKSAAISPDGMLGGRGYVMSVKEIRKSLYEACESLSAISDTIHDEINAEHWKPNLGDLGENETGDIKKYLEEAQDFIDDPGQVEEEAKEIESENDSEDSSGERWGEEESEEEEGEPQASSMPGKEAPPQQNVPHLQAKQSSTVDPNTLPGPRVQHLQPEHGLGPYGSENDDEPPTIQWNDGDDNPYRWEPSESPVKNLTLADSTIPVGDPTSRDADDFGLGWGADGDGIGSAAAVSPTSGLPVGTAKLPNDGEDPVARSDYFDGPKGNLGTGAPMAESRMPGGGPVPQDYQRPGGYAESRGDIPVVERPMR